MNLLNINLIRKKSQEFYKIIPEFYQSAPCMIVRRVLVLITNRRRGSLPLSRLANLPRFVLRLLFQFLQLFSPSLFFAFVSRRISDYSDTQTRFFFYMQKSAIASPIRLFDVAKKTSGLLVFSLVLLAGFEPARYRYRGILSPSGLYTPTIYCCL